MTGNLISRNLCFLLAFLCMMCACQQDEFQSSGSSVVSGGGVSLAFSSDPMQQYNVTTRSSDGKTDEEKAIKQLYIFFFTADGEWLTGSYLEGYADATGASQQGGYIAPGQGSTLIKIANEEGSFTEFDAAKKAIIYAVANVESTLFHELDENNRPQCLQEIIENSNGTIQTPKAALESICYKPVNFIFTILPETGMPMISDPVQIDLTGTTGQDEEERIIQLKALMARIDLNLKLESDITDQSLPGMLLTSWKARNLPTQVSFSPTASGGTTSLSDDTKTERIVSSPTQLIYNKQGEIELSFYMFENMQQAEWKKDDGETWVKDPEGITNPDELDKALYPDSIKDYQKQHYKPYLANQNATAIELNTQYTTYNNATYTVAYTLYLGSNHTNNFEVQRNHQYKNNIVVKGLTQVGTNPEHITFDARVNVTEQDNKYYIAILRERNHDAHFCVTPMDVYMFDTEANPTIEITFLNNTDLENGTPWIRMEKVDCEVMRTGKAQDDEHLGFPSDEYGEYHAGNGKRKYFTTDLVTTTLAESGKEVTINKSRDRVYFYIDENLSDSHDRTAIVQLTYKDDNGTSSRTLEITQTHFLRVSVYNRVGDKKTDVRHYIYMEQYEEYLNHYDPLDQYNTTQIYIGLPWGLKGVPIGTLSSIDWTPVYDNYYKGLTFTNAIIADHESYGLNGLKGMNLNSIPNTAFDYCYNRNKRDENGEVLDGSRIGGTIFNPIYEPDNRKYFLPGIREMEDALMEYYTTFREFQNNFYWSSAAGKAGSGNSQNVERARATKIDDDENYVGSSEQTKDQYENGGGSVPRDISLRIRAFRTDLKPMKAE